MPDGTQGVVAPSLEIARNFVALLTGSPDRPIRLRFVHDDKEKRKFYASQDLHVPSIATSWAEIVRWQQDGYGVFYFLNETLPQGSGYRGAARDIDVVAIRALATDNDAGLPDEWHVEPSLIVRTSTVLKDGREVRKGQALWLAPEVAIGEFKEAQTRLAAYYKSDTKISNPSRVLRLPGSLHQKDPARPQLVEFEDRTKGLGHTVAPTAAEVLTGLPPLSPASRRKLTQPRSVPNVSDVLSADDGLEWDEEWNIERGRQYLAREVAAGRVAVEGAEDDTAGNHTLFRLACQLRDFLISERAAIDLVWESFNPHCNPPWASPDLTFTQPFNSAYRGNAQNEEPGCNAVQSGSRAFADHALAGAPAEVAARKQDNDRIDLLSIDQIMELPDPVPLVESLIMEGENTCWVGPPKVGKTFAALELAMSIAAGLKAFGHYQARHHGAVIYLSGEGHAGMKRRLRAWGQHRGMTLAQIRKLPFYYNKRTPLAADGVADALRFVEKIKARIDGLPVLIIIDTMARSLAGLDENSSDAATRYLDMTEVLRDQLQCTTLTLAHASSKERNGRPVTLDRIDIRGSSGFPAGFDAVWVVAHHGENKTVILKPKWLKERDDNKVPPLFFRIRTIAIEGMENGEGAVLDYVSAGEAIPYARVGAETKGREREVRDAIMALGAYGIANGKDDREMATQIVGSPLPHDKGNDHELRIRDKKKDLRNFARTGTSGTYWKEEIVAKGTPPGTALFSRGRASQPGFGLWKKDYACRKMTNDDGSGVEG